MDFGLAFPSLVLARLFLAFAPVPDVLKHDQQLSSPLTSYRRCAFSIYIYRRANISQIIHLVQEGVFLFEHDVEPYSGGLFRHVRSMVVWWLFG